MQDSKNNNNLSGPDIFFIRSILGILILGFISIIALQFGANFTLKSFIAQEKGIANLITISASQRLHSQRIGLLTFLSLSSKSKETKEKILISLRDEIMAMEEKQTILTSESQLAWKGTGYSQEIINILYQPPHTLNAKVQKFISRANEFLKESSSDSKKQNEIAYELTEISATLLSDFGDLTDQFRLEGIEGINNLSQQSQKIFSIVAVIVFLIGIYVMIPLFRRLKAEFVSRNGYQRKLEEKNNELSDFASIIAHDLKAPLANISGFSSILRDNLSNNEVQTDKDILESIDKCALKMSDMIQGLLTYAKVSGSTEIFEEISLQEVTEKVVTYFERELEEIGGVVEYLDLPHVSGTKIKLEHLFQNLIGNAIKYRDKEKNLKLSIYQIENDNEDYTRIVVEDNGIGLKNGEEDYIFEPFKRATDDNSIEGTGLGLALCKKIVDQHGGTIRAKSSQTLGGAAFEFTLPVSN